MRISEHDPTNDRPADEQSPAETADTSASHDLVMEKSAYFGGIDVILSPQFLDELKKLKGGR